MKRSEALKLIRGAIKKEIPGMHKSAYIKIAISVLDTLERAHFNPPVVIRRIEGSNFEVKYGWEE